MKKEKPMTVQTMTRPSASEPAASAASLLRLDSVTKVFTTDEV
jgi:hypothetical protein